MSTRRGANELTSSMRIIGKNRYRSSQGAMLAMAMLEIERMRLAAETRRIDTRLLSIAQRQDWIVRQQRSLWSIASQAGVAEGLSGNADSAGNADMDMVLNAARARGDAGNGDPSSPPGRFVATPLPTGARSRRLAY